MGGGRSEETNGYIFISYVREDGERVDRLQRILEDAGFNVWRDIKSIPPGYDFKLAIRRAIQAHSLAFIACFSENTDFRAATYQNEELNLASERMRQLSLGLAWLFPVRFDECDIPGFDLGAGRRLDSLQSVDLFDDSWEEGIPRLVGALHQVLAGVRSNDVDSPHPMLSNSTTFPGTQENGSSVSHASRTLQSEKADFSKARLARIGAAVVGVVSILAFALLGFVEWGRRPEDRQLDRGGLSSCDPAALPKKDARYMQYAANPLMYGVSSTHTRSLSDLTAQAYGIPREGWIQQVFLATQAQITRVSAVLSTHKNPLVPLPIIFQVRTLGGHNVATAVRRYNGSTDNAQLYATFPRPISVVPGDLYVLRVINASARMVYVYAHYLDRAEAIPFRVPACEYSPLNSPLRQLAVLKNELGPQVLSGDIATPR